DAPAHTGSRDEDLQGVGFALFQALDSAVRILEFEESGVRDLAGESASDEPFDLELDRPPAVRKDAADVVPENGSGLEALAAERPEHALFAELPFQGTDGLDGVGDGHLLFVHVGDHGGQGDGESQYFHGFTSMGKRSLYTGDRGRVYNLPQKSGIL
ncbi:MAG: hypothetical protein Q8O91_01985, partial [Candidatus Aminicenantes bacterium]|nr:hypothetical protein [Candidatus Aminicenantes bacterium]